MYAAACVLENMCVCMCKHGKTHIDASASAVFVECYSERPGLFVFGHVLDKRLSGLGHKIIMNSG